MGTLLIFSGIGICALALRIWWLPPGAPILEVMNRGWPKLPSLPEAAPAETLYPSAEAEEVLVHVWTPTAKIVSLNQGVSRYVAALDKDGVISTGHAALELPPDVYISLYPAEEIDRSRTDFTRILRATADNDVPGTFQPSYAQESADWTPSTMQVRFPGLDADAIRKFSLLYQRDSTYNLTNRSCASSVAKALDAGIEGFFERHKVSPFFLLRLLIIPEFWVAGFMRQRADAMAWTPGIMLDYARALSYILSHSSPLGQSRENEAKKHLA